MTKPNLKPGKVIFGFSIFLIIASYVYFSFIPQNTKTEKLENIKNESPYNHPSKFADYHKTIRMNPNNGKVEYSSDYKIKELEKALNHKKRLKSGDIKLDWKERGPHNVSGRTWKLIIDPDDPTGNTWFTASAGGGVWKTVDKGETWQNKTPDLPNLSVKSLVMDPSDSNTLYAGTGDEISGLTGSGIFKSTDKGNTWIHLPRTSTFGYIENIMIDPDNQDHILVQASGTALFETNDGGGQWNYLKKSENSFVHPDNFSVLFSLDKGNIEKSTDGGLNWKTVYSFDIYPRKISHAFAPGNSSILYILHNNSDLVISYDSGENWITTKRTDGNTEPFLGNMGYFANSLVVDPYNQNNLIAGGVDISNIKITGNSDEFGANSWLSNTNTDTFVLREIFEFSSKDSVSISSIEIRFGKDIKQKAHHFTVPNKSEYKYEDYIIIPFEVWDITNNRQLTASFLDHRNEGYYNNNIGSNVLYISDFDYSDIPNNEITSNGILHNAIGTLAIYSREMLVDYPELPDSRINIELSLHRKKEISVYKLSTWAPREATNYVHADNLHIQLDEKNGNPYRIISTNDGGVSYSDDAGQTWQNPINGYVTTQFYGIDKHPSKDIYIGGMQDNGSWISQENPGLGSVWTWARPGDGFDPVWHPYDTDKIIATWYYNNINLSMDGGASWKEVSIKEQAGSFGSPFFTNIGYSQAAPDQLFFTDCYGIFRSSNFGVTWDLTEMRRGALTRMPVTVSEANPDIVWTGTIFGEQKAYNQEYNGMWVSTDKGISFTQLQSCPFETFSVSDIATHPYSPNTAFVLYAQSKRPKILRTDDLGKTWKDISGFNNNYSSSNGFTDVAVYCLLVMPYNPDEIWVGTDIGLFISMDNGDSWQIADNGLPNVAIWDMKIRGDQVIVATHGRGAWSVTLDSLNNILRNPVIHNAGLNPNGKITLNYSNMSEYDSVHVLINDQIGYTIFNSNKTIQDTMFLDSGNLSQGEVNVQLKAFKNENSCFSGTVSYNQIKVSQPAKYYFNDFEGDQQEDFYDINFQIKSYGNFPGKAAHSMHPYPKLNECFLYLNVPIIVTPDKANGKATIKYNDIPMVDMHWMTIGESDYRLADYVVVEGSKDGLSWKSISDEYNFELIWNDASAKGVLFPDYEPVYDLQTSHAYNLLDAFQENDTILIRFRLSSTYLHEGYENYWGWMIDDLEIQSKALSTDVFRNNSEFNVKVFPNPTQDMVNISGLPGNEMVRISVYNSAGIHIMSSETADQNVTLNFNTLPNGTYIIKLSNHNKTFKVIKN